ncbi:MAG: hypothetical protein IH984_17445 [Planctomycetes bacterium]|nr:hypothetical protein [Planctomycetota bacterium]
MVDNTDQLRSQLGKALNVVTALNGIKSFESLRQEYESIEKEFLESSDESDIQLCIKQRVSERIFGDAVINNCAIDDLERYFIKAAKLGFSCSDIRISSTIIYCQSLMNIDRIAEAKKLLEDLLDFINEIEDANPGTFIKETFVTLQSLISQCKKQL